MSSERPEDELLQSVALKNAAAILQARHQAEQALLATQKQLRESNKRITAILESITDGFAVFDEQWRFTYLNPKAQEILLSAGRSPTAVIGKSLWQEFPDLVNTPLETAYRKARDEHTPVDLEFFHPLVGKWFDIRAYPSREGLSVHFQDVTRRKEAEDLLACEKNILELIAKGSPLQEVLDAITRSIERLSTDGVMCSVLLLDADGKRLRHGAAPSLPQAYNDAVDGLEIGPKAGSCGTAAFTRRPVEVCDISTDPLWADYRDIAAMSGVRSCCSTPILSSGSEVLGTIAMYYQEVRSPSARDRQLITVAARLAAIVIERARAHDAIRETQERLTATFEQAAVGIALAGFDGRFQSVNGKFAEIAGYSADELRQRTFLDITHPDDREVTKQNVQRLVSGDSPHYILEKRYVRKDGSTVWSLTSVTLLRDAKGLPKRFIGVVEDITRRKQTEAELQQSDQFNRSIIESSLDCIKTLTLDGTVLWINERGRNALCISDAGEVIGRSWIEFWAEDARDQARQAVRTAEQGGVGRFLGMYAVKGEPRWWNVIVTPIGNASGRPEKLLAVSRDVTDRIENERRLRDSEEELRGLADSIPQLAWMARPDGDIFWYNRQWYEYTGTTLEQMQGWGWQSVHDPAVLPKVLDRWRESLATGTPFEMEFPLRGADGKFRAFLTRVNPLRDQDGKVVRWFGTNTDVEQVRQIREALEEETRTLELLNQTGTKLASSLELQPLLQTITDAATELSGAQFGAFFYNMTDEQGDRYMLYTLSGAPREAFAKFGQPRATDVFGPTFRNEAIIRSDDIRKDPRYGKWAPHHGMPPGHLPVRSYLAVPVVSRSGDVIGGLFFGHPKVGVFGERSERIVAAVAAQAAVAIDNAQLYQTAQRATQERESLLESERFARSEAERASRMKDEFLATLSHELRTPLSAIMGWAHVLRSGRATEKDMQQGLEAIERNARAQTQLIEDLLDMSRIVSGKVRLDVQSVEPVAFIEAAIETLRPAADAKEIRIEKVLDPGAFNILGDAARLQQVVWNLLSNAIKFTPKGGKIQVALERVNSHIEITVADTGIGIEPEFLDHVFERFRQADASTTRQFGGLGLGLAIVKHLVELHGGSVRAKSRGKGLGATFIVTLPLAVITAEDRSAPRHHPRAQKLVAADFQHVDLSGVRVLVVDDQADARELVSRVLAECNAEVISAAGAEEALALLEQAKPTVLVSDIGMPGVDGYEFLRRVRALGEARGGRTPAVALTAFARSEDRTRALRAGFLVHVSKPVEPSELVATVASAAGRFAT